MKFIKFTQNGLIHVYNFKMLKKFIIRQGDVKLYFENDEHVFALINWPPIEIKIIFEDFITREASKILDLDAI